MNGQERFYRALRCEEVDRMPAFWTDFTPHGKFERIWQEFVEKEDNPELEECVAVTAMGDLTKLNWFAKGTTDGKPVSAGGLQYPKIYYNVAEDRFYTREEAKHLSPEERRFQMSPSGSIREYEPSGVSGWYHGPYFTGPEFLERMDALWTEFGAPWEAEISDGSRAATQVIEAAAQLNYPHAIWGWAPSHFETMWGGLGPKSMGILMRKKPGVLRDLCAKFAKICLAVEQRSIDAGHTIIKTGDDLGQKDRPLIAPRQYEEFFLPALRDRCAMAHKAGAVVFMHSCGHMEELVPSFLKAGLDGLQSLEVPAGNDLGRIRALVGTRMCLVGGLDSSVVMTFGTPVQCVAHVRDQMRAATTLDGDPIDGGYIPGPAHNLIDTPMENVRAVRDAIAKYGAYPLDFS
jgi:uroporphyrinogen-III decarboxylase